MWDLLLETALGRAEAKVATETVGADGATGFWLEPGRPATFRRVVPPGSRFEARLLGATGTRLELRWDRTRAEAPVLTALAPYHDTCRHAAERLTLTAIGGRVFVGSPRVLLPSVPRPTPRVEELKLLLSCDTLRADALGAYGAAVPSSPHLDRLARRSVVYADAIANSPWTLPSHMTLLTGLYPGEHRVTPKHPLAPGFPTLAERLRAKRFSCAGFATKVGWLDGAFGFSRGFSPWVLAWEDARPTIDRALAWLDDAAPARAFLFLHFYDVHSDGTRRIYDAPAPFGRALVPGEPALQKRHGDAAGSAALLAENARRDAAGPRRPEAPRPPEAEELLGCYREGTLALDHDVGHLLAELRVRRLAAATIIVTADHGEEMAEHGRYLHDTLHGEVAQVPLLVAGAGKPRIEEAPVELTQVSGLVDAGHIVPAAARYGFGPAGLRSIAKGRYKLLAKLDAGPLALYDVERDPGETVDLRGAEPDVARGLHAELLAQLARNDERYKSAAAKAASAAEAPVLPEEEMRRLEGLGYLDR